MMHVMVMMMMVMVVMMVMMVHGSRLGHGSRGGRRSGFLRDGVSGEAERENGRGDKALDHGKTFLWLRNPNGSRRTIEPSA
jgi:hypothetical protein